MVTRQVSDREFWDGYEIGDRVRFKDEYGDVMYGRIEGRGAAGSYLKIRADDGTVHEGYSSDRDITPVWGK